MTSEALKIKKSPTLGLLRVTLQKNAGGIILLSIAMLIFCPGFFITTLSKEIFHPEDYTSPDVLDTVYGVTAVISCILVCVANYVNFAYLYKKNSSDVFHALPLTRGGTLFARAAAGFISILVPVTIGYAALAFLGIPYPSYAVGTLSQTATAYLVNVLLMLAFSGYSLIFIVCAGNGFDLVVSFGGLNIAVFACCAIIDGLCSNYLSGYMSEFEGLMRIFSPVYNLAERGIRVADGGYTLRGLGNTVPGILEFAAAFFIIATLLYRFRKAERGEQAYAYKFIYVLCGVLAGICGGYALSEIFSFAADKEEYSIIGFVAFVAGALITTVVYGAVTNRGFRGFKRSMAIGGVSAAVYALAAVIILSGAFGFEKRIPNADKVTEVTVVVADESVDFKDPKAAIALHKAIINRNADEKTPDDFDVAHDYAKIIYSLSNKGIDGDDDIVREYFAETALVKDELFKIYSSDERFAVLENFIESAMNDRININGDYSINEDETAILGGSITKEEAKKVLAVYREELNKIGADFFGDKQQSTRAASIYFESEIGDIYETKGIYTTSAFTETNKMLKAFSERTVESK